MTAHCTSQKHAGLRIKLLAAFVTRSSIISKHAMLQFLRWHKYDPSDSRLQTARTQPSRTSPPSHVVPDLDEGGFRAPAEHRACNAKLESPTKNFQLQYPTTRACSMTIGHRRLMVSDCHLAFTWLEGSCFKFVATKCLSKAFEIRLY